MQPGQITADALHPLDQKRIHRIIELTLSWLGDHSLKTFHAYHDLRGAVIRQIEHERSCLMTDVELLVFDAVLDSLEQLNYAYWCADEEDPDQSDIYTYYYVIRPINLTSSQIQWHFKMRNTASWLRTYATQKWVPDTFRKLLQLFSNRLLYYKYEADYRNFRDRHLTRARLDQFLFWAALQIMEPLFSIKKLGA